MTQDSKNKKNNKKINITQIEMENAFRSHKGAWEACKSNPNHTYKMVLFYAVECGLKSYYMRKNNLISSSAAADNEKSASAFLHNLNDLSAKLNIAVRIPDIKKNVDNSIHVKHLHTAWRYGKKLDEQEETVCIKRLTKILNDIKNKLALPGGIS